MRERNRTEQSDKGLSAGVLALVFLVCVAVCAVFFSLGFLVGYNEQSSKRRSPTEQVASPSPNLPPDNAQLNTSESPEQGTAPPSSAKTSEPSQRSTRGTPRVQISPSPPPPPPLAPSQLTEQALGEAAGKRLTHEAQREKGGKFMVQVIASRSKEDSRAVFNALKLKHYHVVLLSPRDSRAGDAFFRVQVGPFTSRRDAEKVRAKLARDGFKPFIKH